MRIIYVRLLSRQALELEIMAKLDKVSMTEIIRRAIKLYIKYRCLDPHFRQRLQEEIENSQRILNIS